MEGFKIGELSRLTGIPTGTIRYYEREGLVPTPPRSSSGYRKYTRDALERLQVVLRLKQLGFTLGEISDLLSAVDDQCLTCHERHCRAAAKMHELDMRIQELQRIKQNLKSLVKDCEADERKCTLLSVITLTRGIAGQIAGQGES
jgi:MerR family copper efflux transcriptional regulator